jgi:hypothetical protein
MRSRTPVGCAYGFPLLPIQQIRRSEKPARLRNFSAWLFSEGRIWTRLTLPIEAIHVLLAIRKEEAHRSEQ